MKKIMMGCLAAAAAIITLASCSQDYTTYSGPSHIMFSDTLYQYPVQQNNEIFNVPVSATERADYDRTFAVEVVDRESNAIEDYHYRILDNTVTIKAGEMVGNVQVQGIYDHIGKNDSLGFTLKLVIPEKYNWTELYKDYTHVVMQKSCPFDIHNFTGWCVVTSTFYNQYLNNVKHRLIRTELAEGEENTVWLKDVYYAGYDLKLKFKPGNPLEPKVEMDDQIAGPTGEAFNTIHGDGKLRISQPSVYPSYFNTCQNYVMQYVTMSVKDKKGSLYGTVGTFITLYEWISDAEAERIKEQGF